MPQLVSIYLSEALELIEDESQCPQCRLSAARRIVRGQWSRITTEEMEQAKKLLESDLPQKHIVFPLDYQGRILHAENGDREKLQTSNAGRKFIRNFSNLKSREEGFIPRQVKFAGRIDEFLAIADEEQCPACRHAFAMHLIRLNRYPSQRAMHGIPAEERIRIVGMARDILSNAEFGVAAHVDPPEGKQIFHQLRP